MQEQHQSMHHFLKFGNLVLKSTWNLALGAWTTFSSNAAVMTENVVIIRSSVVSRKWYADKFCYWHVSFVILPSQYVVFTKSTTAHAAFVVPWVYRFILHENMKFITQVYSAIVHPQLSSFKADFHHVGLGLFLHQFDVKKNIMTYGEAEWCRLQRLVLFLRESFQLFTIFLLNFYL